LGQQPVFKFTVGFYVPKVIFCQSNQYTIQDYAALRRAGNGIAGTPRIKVVDTTGKDAIQQRNRIRTLYINRLFRRVVKHDVTSQFPILFDDVFAQRNRI